MSGTPTIPKSAFANIDARLRCPTPDCWGDLLLIPTGRADEDGIPSFQPFTACPLCGNSFGLDEDIPPGYRFYVRRYFQLIRPRE